MLKQHKVCFSKVVTIVFGGSHKRGANLAKWIAKACSGKTGRAAGTSASLLAANRCL
jgi:hypothetical protein